MIMRAKPWPSKLEVGQMMFGATGSYVGPGFHVSELFEANKTLEEIERVHN